MSFHQVFTRSLLAGSFVVFVIGAIGLVLGNWVAMSYEEGLGWIAAHPTTWTWSTILLAASLILCVAGLAVFNDYFQFGEARPLAKFGFVTFLFGALFWILAMGFRLSIDPWAAQILVEISSLPTTLTPLCLSRSVLHDIYMFSTFLASSIYGVALLKSPQFPNGLGWFAVGYGLVGATAEAISGGPIPGMALIVPLILGLSPLPPLPQPGKDAI
jgi:hypothetical protein